MFDQNSGGQPALVVVGELLRPVGLGENLLEQQGIDVHER